MANLDRHARAALRKELARAQEQRAQLDAVISYLLDRVQENDTAPAPAGANGATPPAPTRAAPTKRVTAAAAAAKVLADRGRPMRTPDLLIEVRAEGATMKSSDNMYRTLVGNPNFKRVGRGLWALAEWPDEDTEVDEMG